jgi:hypothetical protein
MIARGDLLLVALLGLLINGCTKNTEPPPEPEKVNLFQKGKGIWLPEEMRKDFGVEFVEVTEKRFSKYFKKTAHVFRAPTKGHAGEATLYLSPEEAKEIKVGQGISLNAAGMAEMTGSLVRLDAQLQSVSGQVEGIIEFAGEAQPIDPGAFLAATVPTKEATGVLAVPQSAILDTAQGHFVYTVNGKHLTRTRVKLGAISDGFVEIQDGLYAGDAVAVRGIDSLWLVELSALKGGKPCCAAPRKSGTK